MNQLTSGSTAAHLRLAAWYFMYFAFVGAYMPYFSLYLEAQSLTPSRIALLMTLGQLMRLLTPVFWGWISDYSGRRTPIIRTSALLSMLIFAVYFFTVDFISLVLVTALLHFFWCAALPLVEALTFAHLRDTNNSYGRVRVWGSIGFVVAVFGVGVWLNHQPIASLLAITWLILGLMLLAAWRLKEVATPHFVQSGKPSPSLRQSRVIVLMVVGFLMSAAHGAFYVFYSIHLAANGYDSTATGFLWSLGVIAEVLVFIYMPHIVDHQKLKRLLMLCLALAVLRFLIIGWCIEMVALVVIAQILHGATFGAHHVASVASLNQWFLPGQQGRIQALYGSLSFGGGGLLGGLIAGQTWASLGPELSFTISAGFALLGLAATHFAFSVATAQSI